MIAAVPAVAGTAVARTVDRVWAQVICLRSMAFLKQLNSGTTWSAAAAAAAAAKAGPAARQERLCPRITLAITEVEARASLHVRRRGVMIVHPEGANGSRVTPSPLPRYEVALPK